MNLSQPISPPNPRLLKAIYWAPAFTIPLAFLYGIGSPSIPQTDYGFLYFFSAGSLLCLAIVAASMISLKSASAALHIFVPRAPAGKFLVAGSMIATIACLTGGLDIAFLADLIEHAAARTQAQIDGEFAGGYTTKGCRRVAQFSTSLGQIEACIPGYARGFQARIPMPADLKQGDHVVLYGRENSMIFVLKEIQHAPRNKLASSLKTS